jgi:acyl dehydratase
MSNEIESGEPSRTIRFENICEGTKESRIYPITNEVYDHLLAGFGDRSPIHVEPEFARSFGFLGPVMHGAILNGFLSHFVGMHFPGRLGLLLTVDLRYSQPNYLNDAIQLDAVVTQKTESTRAITMDVKFQNLTRNWLAARGRVQVLLRNET